MSDIFLPGDVITTDAAEKIANVVVYRDENNVQRIKRLSLKRDKSVIPLKGPYLPRIGDLVVGAISEVRYAYYVVDLNVAFEGMLPNKFTRVDYRVGNVISAKVAEIKDAREIILNYPRLHKEGLLIKIDSTKIPRVLGKEDTMINLLRDKLECDIVVGKNGYIWLNGKYATDAIRIIKMIEMQSHTYGLTNRVEELLNEFVRKNGN